MEFVWKVRNREREGLMKNSLPDSEIKPTDHYRYKESVTSVI